MAIHKGWKVLRERRWSATRAGSPIQYPVGKWAKPRRGCGPLAVFSDERQARDFALGFGTAHSCEFKASRFRHLWFLSRGETCHSGDLPFPRGTRFADAVKTLE